MKEAIPYLILGMIVLNIIVIVKLQPLGKVSDAVDKYTPIIDEQINKLQAIESKLGI